MNLSNLKPKKRAELPKGKRPSRSKEVLGYYGYHLWLRRRYGPAYECEACKTKNTKSFDWAKLPDKEYEKKVENYIQLCRSCHWFLDKNPDQNNCRNGHPFKTNRRRAPGGTVYCKSCRADYQRYYDSKKNNI